VREVIPDAGLRELSHGEGVEGFDVGDRLQGAWWRASSTRPVLTRPPCTFPAGGQP
jgi:hypothetical protein